jgi:hypothetical protein
VPDLDKLQLVLMSPQRFKNAVNAVAWKTEDGVHAPSNQPINQQSATVNFFAIYVLLSQAVLSGLSIPASRGISVLIVAH